MAEVTWYILDDRSPAIQWAPPGAWLSHSAGREHNGTSTMSLVPDASVTLTFNGTGIQVFGTITGQVNHEGTPAFQYTIRDADNNEVAGDFWPGSGPTVFNYRAIEETALFPGLHTLAITNQSPDGMFRFDYFRITGTMLPEHNLTATDVTTLSPGGGEPVTSTVFAIPTGDLGRGDRSGEQGAQGVNVATLVVASIASVAFIVGLVILVIFLVRRRRKKRAVIEAAQREEEASDWTNALVKPLPSLPAPEAGEGTKLLDEWRKLDARSVESWIKTPQEEYPERRNFPSVSFVTRHLSTSTAFTRGSNSRQTSASSDMTHGRPSTDTITYKRVDAEKKAELTVRGGDAQ